MKKICVCGAVLILLAGCQPDSTSYNGYVVADYQSAAAPMGGILRDLPIARGARVQAGDLLFALDPTELEAARAAAAAELARARADWADLSKGQRPEEIAVLERQMDQARASWDKADKEYRRAKGLVGSGSVSQNDLDVKKATLDSASAKIAEIEAQIQTARLGGRGDALDARAAAIEAAEQKRIEADKRLADSAPRARGAAYVEDTYFLPGEYVPAGVPVARLLPDGRIKIRFFVAQADVPRFAPGTQLSIRCDGCRSSAPARVNYVASQSEYTPPVIFSVGSRDKLVFRIEAIPDGDAPDLRPGLAVDIDRTDP